MRTLAALLLLAIPAPKPVTVWLDGELDRAWLVAEVEVVAVRMADGMGRGGGGKRGSIQVRVTRDPSRVFRGHEQLGATIHLAPPSFGALGGTSYMEGVRTARKRVVVVVRPDKQMVLVGDPLPGGTEKTLRFLSWCDFNACWVFCHDKTFGKRHRGAHGNEQRDVPLAALAKRLAPHRAPVFARAARLLLRERSALSDAELNRLVSALGSEQKPTREDAVAQLVRRAPLHVARLQKTAATTLHPRIRPGLAVVLSKLEPWRTAHAIADNARSLGAETNAWILIEAMAHLPPATRERAAAHLLVLGGTLQPPLPLPADATAEQAVREWRRQLVAASRSH